ncbi:hypothetical protein ACFQ0G_53800 [Streptomyces chiangmaiensis]|uniref:hypothetical protein n=1 Tax=Streptomyces chiangmaiensis TaxID=766497 RepID=UPI0031E77237
MSYRSIEEALNLPACTFKHLLWGSSGREPSEKIRKETADAVLAFWPSLDTFSDAARIDPRGTRRRAQALATLGWTHLFLAKRVGIAPSNFRRNLCQERVTARFARAVRDAYNELWMRAPMEHEVPAGMVLRTVRAAEKKAWYGPLAWDDDTIDNPTAVPQTDAQPAEMEEDVDEVAIAKFVKGFPVDVTDAEFLAGVQQCVALEMTAAAIDQMHGWEKKTTENRLNKLRKQYQRSGRDFPNLSRPSVRSFSEEEVIAIREKSAAGATDVEVAMSFDTSRETVRSICRGQRYPQYGGPIRAKQSAKSQMASREYMCGHAPNSRAALKKNEMEEAA